MREGIERGDWINVTDGHPCYDEEVEVVNGKSGNVALAIWSELGWVSIGLEFNPACWRPIAR